MTYYGINNDEEIININGHTWQIVDTRFTHSGPTYKLKDVVRARGHIPYPTATSLQNTDD